MTKKFDEIVFRYSTKILKIIDDFPAISTQEEIAKESTRGEIEDALCEYRDAIFKYIGDLTETKSESTSFLKAVESFVTNEDLRRLSLEDCFVRFAKVIDEYKINKEQSIELKEEIEEAKKWRKLYEKMCDELSMKIESP